jgi:ABC-2 type transport system ATP-binding protein
VTPTSTQPAIRAWGLSKRYGAFAASADLDLEVRGAEVLGFLGPNGAGKTTTIRLLLGLIRPSGGRAERSSGSTANAGPRTLIAG